MKRKTIASSTLQVSAAALIIKILGVFKQTLIAAVCGATAETDAYFIATSITMALCSIIFSSVSISLLSMHTERLLTKGRAASNNLINKALRVFLPISTAIAVCFTVLSPWIAKFLAPSYQGEQLDTLARYIRVTSCMFVFSCFSHVLNVVLETDKRFLPGKGQSFLQNLFICIAAVLFYPRYGMPSLIAAFLLAGAAQCLVLAWSVRREFRFVYRLASEETAIYKLLKLSLPLLVGNAIYEINDIVDKQIATGLGQGSVSFLAYGASINEIVTTLIIASVSTVLFSHYTEWAAEGETKRIGDSLKKTVEYLAALILPIMAVCFVCGDWIVEILFGRGNFDASAVKMTGSVVFAYAAGFLFQAMRANLTRVYYAFQNTNTPMINGAISVAVNIILSILLSKVMGISGIALATSIAMLLVTALLLPGIKKYIPGFRLLDHWQEYGKPAGIAAFISVISYSLRQILPWGTYPSFILIGSFIVFGYFGIAYAWNVQAVKAMTDQILHIIKRSSL